ncbi:MAG: GNAT family N-acetyltransferase [Firmicutes bacterium]|uniref:GNAT family N-acetyltransferase n=1 Tax=Candidatus Alloenteromonas pullistercoris TaxID=2840785 RepID=A0A9D9DJA5_9FIRM|nr:GNAT family N-acetyltransferase [Candidatus Enteromonas pullistercoris]
MNGIKRDFELRAYREEDFTACFSCFKEAIYATCGKDYAPNELIAWAEGASRERMAASLVNSFSLVAVNKGTVIGFGNLVDGHYLDLLYVSPAFQKQGVATAICDLLEANALADIEVYASKTAYPFFAKRGYSPVRENIVERNGAKLQNFLMEKPVLPKKPS